MNSQSQNELERVRALRLEGDADQVLQQTAILRQLVFMDELAAEAAIHMAWAYGQLGRDGDAVTLYERIITDREFADHLTPLLEIQALCDYSLILQRRGKQAKAAELVDRALAKANTAGNEEARSIATAAAASISRDDSNR